MRAPLCSRVLAGDGGGNRARLRAYECMSSCSRARTTPSLTGIVFGVLVAAILLTLALVD